jgi:glycerol transport system ATP-binding protein
MAKITLNDLRHSYMADPKVPADYALKKLDVEWRDGGAYALLGPSGCGKTTLLNIISGLLIPSHGQVLFGDRDVTKLPTDERNIAQVFQFPVVYDTMSVYDNLAFPLRNRGVSEDQVDKRVRIIAEMTDLTGMLKQRASGLTADGKQKISLGRGLVREDVNVIMFDEPLTVIDPHLKWLLRSKLKELHQRLGTTMIYVTHDQTEALTFADQVVVMKDGEVVQIGTPVELFEKPRHTFVGHFIGSPGMNIMPCNVSGGEVAVGGTAIGVDNSAALRGKSGAFELGVRPEFTTFAKSGLPVRIAKVTDTGRSRIVDARHDGRSIKLLVEEGQPIPDGSAFLAFDRSHAQVYADGWLVE